MYAQRVHAVLDILEQLLNGLGPTDVVVCAEHVMARLDTAMSRIDDSNGYLGSAVSRLQDLHHAACVAAHPASHVGAYQEAIDLLHAIRACLQLADRDAEFHTELDRIRTEQRRRPKLLNMLAAEAWEPANTPLERKAHESPPSSLPLNHDRKGTATEPGR